ncbi:MAG: AbrB/MazE/SpoVT family DNA-binding domain-containing protein [Candidatus Peribacteraceae bacterium]|nr:AbrB/MazE/SpoVT family DNA-binding domain-containing protein [Candidatus Peribacteraceae bacterium]
MQTAVISSRGQITLPKKVREKFGAQAVEVTLCGDKIMLKPLQTRESFFAELDAIEKDYEKNGGISLSAMKKKYKLG